MGTKAQSFEYADVGGMVFVVLSVNTDESATVWTGCNEYTAPMGEWLGLTADEIAVLGTSNI